MPATSGPTSSARSGGRASTPSSLDDLSSGLRGFVPDGRAVRPRARSSTASCSPTIREHGVTGVVHVAGFKYAGVSVQRPLHTYEQNVTGTATLLGAMADAGVDKVVFSSTAAVYGTPDVEHVIEATPKPPESPYGESKLIGEWLLADQGRAVGLHHTSLRYFNVVGSGAPDLYDTSPHNLFPLVFDALLAGRTPRINGDDYPTPDGTCVRDYVHVADLAHSHVVAARRLAAGEPARAGLQPRLRRRASASARSWTRSREGTGIDFDPGGRPAPPRRPGAHRRLRRAGGPRPRLGDAPLPRRHGRQRLERPGRRQGRLSRTSAPIGLRRASSACPIGQRYLVVIAPYPRQGWRRFWPLVQGAGSVLTFA